jgi:putative chitinase
VVALAQTLTPDLLRAATGCTPARAAEAAPHLAAACALFDIGTPARLVAFLAQVAHESGRFEHVVESLNYSVGRLTAVFGPRRISAGDAARYGRTAEREADEAAIADLVYGGDWGARNLGNTNPGDGWRYRGHGWIQVTGRGNHVRMRDVLRGLLGDAVPDFEADPEALCTPRWAALSAGAFWSSKGCNDLADAGDFDGVTQRVNGGLNGAAERRALWGQAKAALAEETMVEPLVSLPAGEAPDWTPPPAPDPATPTPTEAPVAPFAASLLVSLAQNLFSAFQPLAQEKLTKELSRHTDRPEVAQNLATAVIGTVQSLTGKADPLEAVMAAKTDPAVLAKVEVSALEQLERMAPLLERLAALDRQTFAAEEASRDAADRRARESGNDQDPYLTRAIVRMMVGLFLVLGGLMGVLAWKGVSETVLMAVFGLFNAAGMIAVSKFGTRYDHRYGSSVGSASKDAALASMARTKP